MIPAHLKYDVQVDEILNILRGAGTGGLSLHAIDSKCKHTATIDDVRNLLDDLVKKKKIEKRHAFYFPAGGDQKPVVTPSARETNHTKPSQGETPMATDRATVTVKVTKLKGMSQIKIFNAIPDDGCFLDHLVKTTGMGRDNIQGQIHHLKRKGLVKSRMIKPEKGGHANAFYARTKDVVAVPLTNEPDHPLKIKTETAYGKAADPSAVVSAVKVTHKTTGKKPGKRGRKKKNGIAAALQKPHTASGDVEDLLANNLAVAQENLDAYVQSQCDAQTLGYFQLQRDTARKILADYQARQS